MVFTVSFGNGNGTFQSPVFYPIPDQDTDGLAVGDFNGDGIPDGLTIGEEGAWLLTGKGSGCIQRPGIGYSRRRI